MLGKRILVVAVMLPVGLAAIILGDLWYFAAIALILGLAAPEFSRLFETGGYHPVGFLIIAGILILVTTRYFWGLDGSDWALSLIILGAMAYHLIAFERGRPLAGVDFSITVTGVAYLGWIGSYLISLRALPGGMWWVLTVLPSVWLADTGAYLIGKAVGKHKMSPRLSPGKTWEGFLGGIIFATLGTPLLVWGYLSLGATAPGLTPLHGLWLGLVLSLLTPLGDLGESMIKRQVGAKDSGTLLPGHGGMFDRIDSWLWAGVIGYYLIVWIFQT